MTRPDEQRQHTRLHAEAWISCPTLSPHPLAIENISSGGFSVLSKYKPQEGHPYPVSLRVGGSDFGPCTALTAWCQEHVEQPGLWAFGMLIMMKDEEREKLAETLEAMAVIPGVLSNKVA